MQSVLDLLYQTTKSSDGCDIDTLGNGDLISIFGKDSGADYWLLLQDTKNMVSSNTNEGYRPEEEEEEDFDNSSVYDESFERSFYWDTSSQLTSSPEEDNEDEEEEGKYHNKETHHNSNISCQKLNQFTTKEDINTPWKSTEPDEDKQSILEIIEQDEMKILGLRKRHVYYKLHPVYNEVLETFAAFEKSEDLISIQEVPETPSTTVSSIFSHTQTPNSAISSHFDDFDSHDVDDETDDNDLLIFQKKPSAGSRLMRKISRTFSTSSLAPSVTATTATTTKTSQMLTTELPFKITPEPRSRLRESSSFSNMRHRFSIASFQDSKKNLNVPKQRIQNQTQQGSQHILKEKNSMASLQREVNQIPPYMKQSGNSLTKISSLRSVANFPTSSSSLTKRSTSNLGSIEDTIGFKGADDDEDYLEFKRNFLRG